MNRKSVIYVLVPVLLLASVLSCVKVKYDVLDSYRSEFSIRFVWPEHMTGVKSGTDVNACPDSMVVLMAHADFGSRDTLVMHRTDTPGEYVSSRDTTLVRGRYFTVAYGTPFGKEQIPMMDDILQGRGQISKVGFCAPSFGSYKDSKVMETVLERLELSPRSGLKLDFNPSCPEIIDTVAPLYWASALVNLSAENKTDIEFAPRIATVDIEVKVKFVDVSADTVVACLAGIPQSLSLMECGVYKESLGKSYFRLLPDANGIFTGSIRTFGLFDSNPSVVMDDGPGILYVSIATSDARYCHYTLDLGATGVLSRQNIYSEMYVPGKRAYSRTITLQSKDLSMDYNPGGEFETEDRDEHPEFK